MNININDEDFGILSICAIRYCQGRQTYMPSLVRGIIKNHIKELSDNDLTIMINDCKFQEEFNLFGDEKIDKPGWVEWKEELLKEKSSRNN